MSLSKVYIEIFTKILDAHPISRHDMPAQSLCKIGHFLIFFDDVDNKNKILGINLAFYE